ncbi:MAG: hypothetical protein H6R20_816 [Proteobacteria bacterium]|nr:hypothetical protein [Pseudomonadota bacterium]
MTHRHAQRGTAAKTVTITILVLLALAAAYFAVVLNWNYSTGERAGWVQKFSKKGWLCKTWEGELALVTMPGTSQEKFLFTVRDDAVAEQINKAMGKRVSLHYEEKVGLPLLRSRPPRPHRRHRRLRKPHPRRHRTSIRPRRPSRRSKAVGGASGAPIGA